MERFDSAIDKFLLRDVTLTSETGIISVFGLKTHLIAEKLFESICLYNSGIDPEVFESRKPDVYKMLEHYAKVGAYIATITDSYSKVYDVGCGIGLPLLAYSSLTGKNAVGIDSDWNQINLAKGVDKMLDSKVHFLQQNVENILTSKNVGKDDFVLYCGRAEWLTTFQSDLVKETGCTAVFSTLAKTAEQVPEYVNLVASKSLAHIKDVFFEEKEPDRLVFVAKK
jgi:SAM-dependent methyltransferase